jgi:hypothetical protein
MNLSSLICEIVFFLQVVAYCSFHTNSVLDSKIGQLFTEHQYCTFNVHKISLKVVFNNILLILKMKLLQNLPVGL